MRYPGLVYIVTGLWLLLLAFALLGLMLLTPETFAAKPPQKCHGGNPACQTPSPSGTPTASPSPTPSSTPTPSTAPTASSTATPSAIPTASPSSTPTASPASGWAVVFRDDFDSWDASRYFVYANTWRDTSGRGLYSTSAMSAAGGILNVHLATVNGTPRVAAFVPLPAGTGPRGDMLGMRTELRIRADLMPGYKGVPLLWPNADNNFPFWGEIDWPESDFANQPRAYMHRQGATTVNDQDTYTSLTGTTWQQWHTYVLEWVPGVSAAFYEDGTLIGRSTSRVPAGPMHWVLQFETSLSTVPAAATQGNVQIDYLQVSAQGGPSSTPSPSPTASSTASPSPTASSSPTSTATPTPSPTPSSGTTIVAVGDIHGEGSDADSVATNNLVNSINPTAVLGLGDYQYSTGTCANFMTSGRYNSDWGVQTRRMYATMGPTHDYDGASAEAHRYFSGQCANQSIVSPGAVAAGGIQDWGEPYSFDLGGWHIVQLPSTCERYSGSTCSVASINTDRKAHV